VQLVPPLRKNEKMKKRRKERRAREGDGNQGLFDRCSKGKSGTVHHGRVNQKKSREDKEDIFFARYR